MSRRSFLSAAAAATVLLALASAACAAEPGVARISDTPELLPVSHQHCVTAPSCPAPAPCASHGCKDHCCDKIGHCRLRNLLRCPRLCHRDDCHDPCDQGHCGHGLCRGLCHGCGAHGLCLGGLCSHCAYLHPCALLQSLKHYCGPGLLPVGAYCRATPMNVNYFDVRDARVYAAQGFGIPVAVPLAPQVDFTYNYGWGIPASRLTPIWK